MFRGSQFEIDETSSYSDREQYINFRTNNAMSPSLNPHIRVKSQDRLKSQDLVGNQYRRRRTLTLKLYFALA